MAESPKPSPGRGWTGQSPGRVWGGARSDLVPPLFRRCGGTFPQGKVENPLPGEGEAGGSNRARFFWWAGSPHPSGPLALPPSPWGKASSGGGFLRAAPSPRGRLRILSQGKVGDPIFSLSCWCRRWSCHGHGPRSGSGNTPSGCRRWRRSCLHSCPRRRPWPR